jgi:hypothetical protein
MKKFLAYFNIFDLNLSSRSYKSGLIRIGVSAIAMLILSLFRLSITLTNPIINLIISILVIGGMVLSILCLFVAAVECLQVSENRKNNK